MTYGRLPQCQQRGLVSAAWVRSPAKLVASANARNPSVTTDVSVRSIWGRQVSHTVDSDIDAISEGYPS